MLNNFRDGLTEPKTAPPIDPGILDSKRLQLFYAAAKEGGFAMAGHALNITPSAVSHSVKSLEEELGCSLFRRSGPNITLTRAGARLLPMVEELMLIMSQIKGKVSAEGEHSENLSFTLPAGLLGILDMGILSVFRECFPASHLDISLRDGDTLPHACDFHIDYEQPGGDDLVRRNLANEFLIACVAPFHPMAHQASGKVFDLRQSLLIFPGRIIHDQIMSRTFRDGRKPRCWILPSPESALEMACQGQGVAFLPNWFASPTIDAGSLVAIKTQSAFGKRTCCAYWRPDRPLSWVAEAFLSLVSSELEKRLDLIS